MHYKVCSIKNVNNIYLKAGFEFINIVNAYEIMKREDVNNGEILWEFEHDLNPHIDKHTGINSSFGFRYTLNMLKFMNIALDFGVLYKIKQEWQASGSSGFTLDEQRISFESKIGFEFNFE